MNRYIIYDDECGFCNKAIMFILKNDRNDNFKFVSNLSEFGINLLSTNNIKGLEKTTIILIENRNKIYIKSEAIRKIMLKLPYYCFFGRLMVVFPKIFSDFLYDLISKYRKLILKNDKCKVPEPRMRKKFIV